GHVSITFCADLEMYNVACARSDCLRLDRKSPYGIANNLQPRGSLDAFSSHLNRSRARRDARDKARFVYGCDRRVQRRPSQLEIRPWITVRHSSYGDKRNTRTDGNRCWRNLNVDLGNGLRFDRYIQEALLSIDKSPDTHFTSLYKRHNTLLVRISNIKRCRKPR